MLGSDTADEELEEGLLSGVRKPADQAPEHKKKNRRAIALAFGCTVVAALYLASIVTETTSGNLTPSFPVPESEQRHWAQYSPYHPVEEYKLPPDHCKVTQVNILQRHGARFPTSGFAGRIKKALDKIQAVDHYRDTRLKFLADYVYDLGVNDLVPLGAYQSFDAGQETFTRYSGIISDTNIPFVRSDSSERVIDSATNWTAGFAKASHNRYNPPLALILDRSGNDTLENTCPASGNSDPQTRTWLSMFASPITAELNAGAPGANLTNEDTFSLISLCPFESVYKLKKSPFCTLFESFSGAFHGFTYMGDIDKFYGTGYGQPLGPAQGVGYVNELLARLTESPVQDETSTNRTLDASPITFPLNRTVYADFSHDNQMIAIMSAIGLFRQPHFLDPARPDPERTWRVSALVPFAGRVVVERMSCAVDRADTVKAMVRVLVQDQVQPLEFCGGDEDGLCTVDALVESQAYARNNGDGDFEKCFCEHDCDS